MHISVIVLCVLWLILTIISQFNHSISRKVLSFDSFGLIPQWTFFAPYPGYVDLHLLVRFSENETLSRWYESPLTAQFQEKFRYSRGIFNPYRRLEKLLFDFTNKIRSKKYHSSQIRYLSEYILVLRFVEELARQRGSASVQFMLAGSNPALLNDIEVIILSDVHII